MRGRQMCVSSGTERLLPQQLQVLQRQTILSEIARVERNPSWSIHSASFVSKMGVYPGAPASRAWRKDEDPETSKHPTLEGENTSNRAHSGWESVNFLALSFNGFLKTGGGVEGWGRRTVKKQKQKIKPTLKLTSTAIALMTQVQKGISLLSRETPLTYLPQRQFFVGYSEAPKEVPTRLGTDKEPCNGWSPGALRGAFTARQPLHPNPEKGKWMRWPSPGRGRHACHLVFVEVPNDVVWPADWD